MICHSMQSNKLINVYNSKNTDKYVDNIREKMGMNNLLFKLMKNLFRFVIKIVAAIVNLFLTVIYFAFQTCSAFLCVVGFISGFTFTIFVIGMWILGEISGVKQVGCLFGLAIALITVPQVITVYGAEIIIYLKTLIQRL